MWPVVLGGTRDAGGDLGLPHLSQVGSGTSRCLRPSLLDWCGGRLAGIAGSLCC